MSNGLTPSRRAAEAMLKACIAKITGFIPSCLQDSMELGEGKTRAVQARALVQGDPASYYATGQLTLVDGQWSRGELTVRFGGLEPDAPTWVFSIARNGGRYEPTMTEQNEAAQAFRPTVRR